MNEFEFVERFSREVCDGKKTMLQVERHLLKMGWNLEEVSYLMQRISDKISERKKGNA